MRWNLRIPFIFGVYDVTQGQYEAVTWKDAQ